jgi:hypothetical protein
MRGVVLIVGLLVLITLAVLQLGRSADRARSEGGAASSVAAAASLDPARCRSNMIAYREAGLLRDVERGYRLIVDEDLWHAASWDEKGGVALMAACDLNGHYVEAYGYRSGRKLAAGSPARGTFRPAD